MRKKAYGFVVFLLLLALTACGNQQGAEAVGADVDLTQLSSTMVYSEVYNMMVEPKDYIGKTVKMKGLFSVYENQETGGAYYSVLIADATACCSQGLEFVLEGEKKYPKDYPKEGEEITVTGEFQVYQEGEYNYCRLVDAKLL